MVGGQSSFFTSLTSAGAALERIELAISWLRDNGVDLQRTKLSVGPLLRIDSAREAFLDHAKANALLTREYREPFVVPAAS